MSRQTAPAWDDLRGKWFHTRCSGGRVARQGQIIGALGQGFYVVRTFDWFVGSETRREIVHVSDMRRGTWALYESDEQMRECYENSIGVLAHSPDVACPCFGERQ